MPCAGRSTPTRVTRSGTGRRIRSISGRNTSGGFASRPRDQVTTVLGRKTLVVAPVYDARTWAALEPEVTQWLDVGGAGGSPLLCDVLRLGALLDDPALGDKGDHEEWVTAACDTIAAINEPRYLSRAARGLMLSRLLAAPVAGAGSQERVARVADVVIAAILEISADAPRYHEMLFEVLEDRLRMLPAARTEKMLRAVRMLIRLRSGSQRSAGLGSPFRRVNADADVRMITEVVDQMLARVGRQPLLGSGGTLGDAAADMFDRRYPDADLVIRRHRLGGGSGGWFDPQLVSAVLVDHYGEHELAVQHDRTTQQADTSTGLAPLVRNLFPDRTAHATLQQVAKHGGYLLGVVASAPPQGQHGQNGEDHRRTAWINCGTGELLQLGLQPSDVLRLGEPIAVKVQRSGEAVRLVGVPAALRRSMRQDGEVRRARVQSVAQFPGLRVEVDGEANYAYPEGAGDEDTVVRDRWDPDIGRALRGEAVAPLQTRARWDEEKRHWLPIDRDRGELLVREFAKVDSCLLTFAGIRWDPAVDEEPSWRFSARPGCSYLLRESDLAGDGDRPDGAVELAAALENEQVGLQVWLTLDRDTGRLRLGADGLRHEGVQWRTLPQLCGDAEALVDARPAADGGWELVLDNPPDGYPDRVALEGLSRVRGRDRRPCELGPWGEIQARKATITAREPLQQGIVKADGPNHDRFYELFNIGQDTVVQLRTVTVKDSAAARQRAYRPDGLPISVKTDSLLPLGAPGGSPAPGFTTDRSAVIVHVGDHVQRDGPGQPLDHAALLAALRPAPGRPSAARHHAGRPGAARLPRRDRGRHGPAPRDPDRARLPGVARRGRGDLLRGPARVVPDRQEVHGGGPPAGATGRARLGVYRRPPPAHRPGTVDDRAGLRSNVGAAGQLHRLLPGRLPASDPPAGVTATGPVRTGLPR